MVPCDVGDDMNIVDRESSQLAVDDQVVSMLMVLPFIDQVTDVVEDRGVFEPRTCCCTQSMQPLRLIEEAQREARDMQAMHFGCLTAPGQCNDAPPTEIGNFGFRLEPFAMA